MSKVIRRKSNRHKRRLKIRSKIKGTDKRPRLSVFRSNKYTYAQLIDDIKGETLAGVSIVDVKKLHKSAKKSVAAFELGKKIAEKAKEKKIKKVVFDRGGYSYQGRIKQVAEGVREGGLEL